MKKTAIAFAAILALASCSKEEKKGNLTINGDVKGLSKGTLYIKQKKDTALVTLDSITISGDSKFSAVVNIDEPEMLYLFLDRGTTNSIDNSLGFFAEPGTMTIDTSLETFYANAKVTGSKNHDALEQYKTVKARMTGQELDITAKEMKALQSKTTLSAEDQAKKESLIRRRYLYTVNFAMNNKDKEVAPFIALAEIPDARLKYLDTINKALTPKIAKSKYGKILNQFIKDRRQAESGSAATN